MITLNATAEASLADSNLVPHPRYYTRADDEIDLLVVRRAARTFFTSHRHHAMRVAYGAGTLRAALDHTFSAATSERLGRIGNPYSVAADAIDAAFVAKFGAEAHEPVNRALAIVAQAEGRAAIAHLSAAAWHASLATHAVNAGADDMTWVMGGADCPLAPVEYIAGNGYETDRVVALNAAGERLLDEARLMAVKYRRTA